MPALTQYSNVYAAAVAVLQAKGFQVWCDTSTDKCFAERDGWDFCAYDPVALLGLVALFEARAPKEYREYWWRKEEEKGPVDLPESPVRPYVSVIFGGGTP